MNISRFIIIIVSILLLAGCGEDINEGIVGEYQSARAEAPGEDGIFDYTWSIVQQPDASVLTADDLELSEDNQTISFIPDYPGTYEFAVIVSDEFDDEVSSQNFPFEIIESDNISDDEEDFAEEDITDSVPEAQSFEDEFYFEPEPVPSYEDQLIASVAKPIQQTYIAPWKPAKPVPGATIPKDPNRYTIQTSAKRTFKDAQKSAESLLEAGFDSYIQKAYFKETDEIWYRVRVGSFESYSAAVAVSANIRSKTKGDTWIDHIRLEN